jgi:hypothetical protein
LSKKIIIQQINEKEIFTSNLPKIISFTDILFNSSYRKIIDSGKWHIGIKKQK